MPQTQAAALRALTAATLIGQNTLAGSRVEEERTLPLDAGELPHLNVFLDESGEARYQGSPQFLVTGKLQIKGTVQRARQIDALADLDTLTWQVKDALLGSSDWVKLANQVLSFGVTPSFKSDVNIHQGEVVISFQGQWLETVTFRPTGPVITGVDTTLQPGVAGVTAPLMTKIDIPSS